jgi:hypothetical protein
MNITMIRACGKNGRTKNCEKSVYEYPRSKKVRWKAKKVIVG